MKKSFETKVRRFAGTVFVFILFCFGLSVQSHAVMSFEEMESRLSSYSESFVKAEDDTFYMEYPQWDISESDLYYVISDIAQSLMGEPIKDYCKVSIKFYYTDKPYGKDFQTFGDNLFRVKKMIGNFWTEWSRYNKMQITVTSYNRVCDKYSANITLHFNGSESGNKGEKYDEKLLEILTAAQNECDTDMETVQYFLKWLDENAVYNYFTGYTNDPYYALIVGNTVCGGYANAFKDLCNAAGIPAIVPVNQEINHAWNQVYVDSKWYTADLCNVVKSQSGTYNGYLFDDPDTPMDCKDFVDSHRQEYIDSFIYSSSVNIGALKVTYKDNFNYTGNSITPEVTVYHGDKLLKKGTHYTVSYSSNKNPGTGKITVKAVENSGYKGERTFSFSISLPKPEIKAVPDKNSVELSWSKVKGATGYIVRMYDFEKGEFYDLSKVSVTSCIVKDLTPGKKYVFAVRAYVSSSSKEYKGTQAKITVYTAPGQVKNLKITAVNSETLKLKWTKVQKAKKYEVYISADGAKWSKLATTSKASYKATELLPNKKYYFKVRAINATGAGDFSKKKSKMTLMKSPDVEIVSGVGQITVSWNRIPKAKGYVVACCGQRSMINSDKYTVKKGRNVKKVITGLKNDKNYYIRVRAYKTVNGKRVYGQYSSVMKVRTN